MKAGKLTCRRTKEYDTNCQTLHCVDYEKNIYNSFDKQECNIHEGWVKYWDVNAKAYYWYNWTTGEATWIPKGGKKRIYKNRTKRPRSKRQRSKRRQRNRMIKMNK